MQPAARFVTILDYGMGNLRSLARALERAGAIVSITDDRAQLEATDRLVIPGQGAFGQAMGRLSERGLVPVLRELLAKGRPVLGVCLGLQLLFEGSEEAPGLEGFGLIPGMVELLPIGPGIKRPHIGWSPVHHASDHPVLTANPSGEAFYFVHSYAAKHATDMSVATATQGCSFVAALAKGPVVATQFHPEKSQAAGDRLLRAWLAL